jgi:acyl-CoA dehydrogenase
LQLLRETVRTFMREDVRPEEAKLDHDANAFPRDVRERLQAKARSLGLWCISVPREYGGAGLSLLAQAVVTEEAAQCRMGLYHPAGNAFGHGPPNVVFKGTREQIERWALPAVESGSGHFVAITEPSGGSDPGRAIQTRAERRGETYVLNGTKTFISGVAGSKWGIVYARTGGAGRRGISCFVVPTDAPGFTATPVRVIRSYYPYEISLQDCEVPAENRIGEEGEGFALAETWLVHGRVPYSAANIGVAQASIDLAVAWAKERETFGSRLADKQAIQWMLADSEIDLRAARLLTYQAAWNADLGKPMRTEASIAKVFASEAASRVVDRCIQILGGMGVAQELPLERWYRELRIRRIGEGPSEVHRLVVARELLGERR